MLHVKMIALCFALVFRHEPDLCLEIFADREGG